MPGRGDYALNFRLTASGRGLTRDLNRAKRDLRAFTREVRADFARLGRLSIGVTAGAVAGIAALANESRQAARDLKQFSTVAGVSLSDFQSFGVVFETFGGELKDAREVLADFQTRLVELQRGESTAVEAFQAIGLAAEDFLGQDVPQAFDTFIQAARNANIDLIQQQTAIDDLFATDREFVLQILRRGNAFTELRQRVREVTGEVVDATPIWGELGIASRLLGVSIRNNFNRALVDSLGSIGSFDGLVKQAGEGVYFLTTGIIDVSARLYELRDIAQLAGIGLAVLFVGSRTIAALALVASGITALVRVATLSAIKLGSIALFGFILTPAGATITVLAAVAAAVVVFRDEINATLGTLDEQLIDIAEAAGGVFPGPGGMGGGIFGNAFEQLEQQIREASEAAGEAIVPPQVVVTADPQARSFTEKIVDRIGEFTGDLEGLVDFGKEFVSNLQNIDLDALNEDARKLLDQLGIGTLPEVDFTGAEGVTEELAGLRRDLQEFRAGGAAGDMLSMGPGAVRDRPNIIDQAALREAARAAPFGDLADNMALSFRSELRRAFIGSGNFFEQIGNLILDTFVQGLQRSAVNALADSLQPVIDTVGNLLSSLLQNLILSIAGGAAGGVTNPALAGSRSPLGLQGGGFVPGPLGAPVPAIVHGGELVLNPGQQEALLGTTVVVEQQIYGNPRQEQRRALLENADELASIVELRLRERRVF